MSALLATATAARVEVQQNLRDSLQTVFRFIGKGDRIEFNEDTSSDSHKQIARGFNQLQELQVASL